MDLGAELENALFTESNLAQMECRCAGIEKFLSVFEINLGLIHFSWVEAKY